MIYFSFGRPCFCCSNCRKHGTLIRNRMEIFVRINTFFNWLFQYVQWAKLVDILDLVREVMWNIFCPFVRLSVRLSVFFLLDPPREIFRYIFLRVVGVLFIFLSKNVFCFLGGQVGPEWVFSSYRSRPCFCCRQLKQQKVLNINPKSSRNLATCE